MEIQARGEIFNSEMAARVTRTETNYSFVRADFTGRTSWNDHKYISVANVGTNVNYYETQAVRVLE